MRKERGQEISSEDGEANNEQTSRKEGDKVGGEVEGGGGG
jgi:hypothetical protein